MTVKCVSPCLGQVSVGWWTRKLESYLKLLTHPLSHHPSALQGGLSESSERKNDLKSHLIYNIKDKQHPKFGNLAIICGPICNCDA